MVPCGCGKSIRPQIPKWVLEEQLPCIPRQSISQDPKLAVRPQPLADFNSGFS